MIDALEKFLRLLFPWETEHQLLYKSIMWKFVPPVGQPTQGIPLANYAAQSYDDLRRLIETRKAKPMQDVWICLGTQRLANVEKTSKDGFPKANRTIPNIVSLKSVWLDLDVKDGAYATTGDAIADLANFVKAKGLPSPTMIVFSGSGGVHVYWCTNDPMPGPAWQALAHGLQAAALDYGLKFDPQVTVNMAGVLRVPTSVNWKNPAQPNPVSLYIPPNENFPIYTYQQLTGALQAHIGSVAGVKGVAPAVVGQGGGTHFTSNFTSGVTTTTMPVSIEDVAVNCAMTADALKRGGTGDPEPLWNMMVMLAAFTDDPVRAAHAVSDQDPRYVKADTDRKLNEKLNARAANPNIGWPKCSFFSTLSPHCRTCPLLVQQKSPLNFAKRPTPGPVGAPPQIGSDELVPAPYWRDARGHLFFNFTPDVEEGAIAQTEAIDLFDRPVLDAGIDELNNQLVFKTIIMHAEVWVQVPSGTNSQVAPLIKALGSAPLGGINIAPFKHKFVRDFTVAWISHLQQQKRTVTAQSYGWADDEQSFSFGETRYTPQGPERAFLGKAFDSRYKELGGLAAWQTAMSLAYGNMPLEAVVATAFAAPLAALMGNTSSVFSVYSAESGVGKSTALKLGQAVWGHPINGMSSLDDTANSVKQKISDLKSLPIYWDELITADALDKVVNLVFSFTQGKGKSRLSRDSTQMPTNAYATMFTVASNHGIGTRMYSGTEGTEAGGLRVFEIQATPVFSRIPGPVADQMMLALATNYGKAGAVYAKCIVEEKNLVEQTLHNMSTVLDNAFHFDQKERFWRVAMTVLLTGATLANRLKLTTFDVPGMFRFLGEELELQRSKLRSKADSTMNSAEAILGVMNQLVSELRGNCLITTEYVPLLGGGRPPRQTLVDMDVTKLENVWVQVGTLDGRIRMRQREFDNWLFKRKLNPDQVIRLLGQHYTVVQDRAQIGAGVPMIDASTQGLTGRSMCYDLTPLIAPGSNPGSP